MHCTSWCICCYVVPTLLPRKALPLTLPVFWAEEASEASRQQADSLRHSVYRAQVRVRGCGNRQVARLRWLRAARGRRLVALRGGLHGSGCGRWVDGWVGFCGYGQGREGQGCRAAWKPSRQAACGDGPVARAAGASCCIAVLLYHPAQCRNCRLGAKRIEVDPG